MSSKSNVDQARLKAALPAELGNVADSTLERFLKSGIPVRLNADSFIFNDGEWRRERSFIAFQDGRLEDHDSE